MLQTSLTVGSYVAPEDSEEEDDEDDGNDAAEEEDEDDSPATLQCLSSTSHLDQMEHTSQWGSDAHQRERMLAAFESTVLQATHPAAVAYLRAMLACQMRTLLAYIKRSACPIVPASGEAAAAPQPANTARSAAAAK